MDEANVFRLAELNRSGRARTASLLVFATKHADDSALRCQMGDVDGVGRHALGRTTTRCTPLIECATCAGMPRRRRTRRRWLLSSGLRARTGAWPLRSDQWDMDTWLANTPAGVVNLRTGKLRPHSPEDYLSEITAVGPDASCPTPLWSAFLARVTGGDAELECVHCARSRLCHDRRDTRARNVFRLRHRSLTEESVLTSTVAGILGDYHVSAPVETFVASNQERHPTDLAGLRGARLVTAVETEEGRRWAEAKIKTLTGGDRVRARFMRQDFFEFVPQFKLWIAGNHKPHLRSVDEAIRRRFHLLPFMVTIPPSRAGLRPGREAQGGVAGHPVVDDLRLPGMAAAPAGTAEGRAGRNRLLPRGRGRDRHLDRRVLRSPAGWLGGRQHLVPIVEGVDRTGWRIRRHPQAISTGSRKSRIAPAP